MQVNQIMTRDVQVVSPETSVLEAARKMRAFDIGCLPVCKGRRCVGIFTDRDIVLRCIADGRDPQNTPVSDIMTTDIVYCSEDEDISGVVKLMEDKQVRRVLILDTERYPVGICSWAIWRWIQAICSWPVRSCMKWPDMAGNNKKLEIPSQRSSLWEICF